MNLHSLKNEPGARRSRTRVGRGMGSGKGKTCGRGHKGQMSRKGSTHKPGFEGGQMRLIRRLPKRGSNMVANCAYVPVNVSALSCFEAGAEIDAAVLRACGLVNGRVHDVKILGNGELDRKLTVRAAAFSASARAKIEAAGGACEVVKG